MAVSFIFVRSRATVQSENVFVVLVELLFVVHILYWVTVKGERKRFIKILI